MIRRSTYSVVQSYILQFTLLLSLLLLKKTKTKLTTTAASISSLVERQCHRDKSSLPGGQISFGDDGRNFVATTAKDSGKLKECNLVTPTSTTWWEDDTTDDNDHNRSCNETRPKEILFPWLLWELKRRDNMSSSHRTDMTITKQQQQQHPLRTDLYEIHCHWRGIATAAAARQQQQQRNCDRKGRRQNKRALWTSRLASRKYYDNDNIERDNDTTLQRSVNDNNNNNNRDNDHHSLTTSSIYDSRIFQLEFNPNGYVRLRQKDDIHQSYHSGGFDTTTTNNNDDDNNNNNSTIIHHNDFIGTWKLQPNGLIVHIPLPTKSKQMMTNEGIDKEEQEEYHIMEMDFHTNPFGTYPKFTRGIIFRSVNDGNPFMNILRLRPIVGTFTGKGIGIDTMDLSYEKRM